MLLKRPKSFLARPPEEAFVRGGTRIGSLSRGFHKASNTGDALVYSSTTNTMACARENTMYYAVGKLPNLVAGSISLKRSTPDDDLKSKE